MSTLSRRGFLTSLSAVLWTAGSGRLIASAPGPRELSFLHTHTGERLSVEYFQNGTYLPDALGVSGGTRLKETR